MTKDTSEAKFKTLIEPNMGIVFKVASGYCPTKEDRKDLTQEIVLQLWRSLPNYDPTFKIATWMYRVALNVAISHFRKIKNSQPQIRDLPENLSATESDDRNSQIDHLYRFINELKELDRALMLLYLDEKSHAEIADVLGISSSNVATKIARIKKQLKDRFSTIKD